MINTVFTKRIANLPLLKQTKYSLQWLFPKLFTHPAAFYKWYNFAAESEGWTDEQLMNYQWLKLKYLLVHCYNSVPYYQNMFRALGASPEDFKTVDDYKKIPFLTRDIIREHSTEFLSTEFDKSKLIKYNTGGSTGEPLTIYKTYGDSLIEEAFMCNQWARVGYKPKDSRVILRGETIGNGMLWKFQPSSNAWIFSSYHLSGVYIKRMVDKLNQIKPKFLHVYPSSLWVFTNLIKENNLKIKFRPKAILAGSEKLYNNQRDLFSEVFGCRTYSWLGLAEQSILAGECEFSHDLHIFPQHSYIELIDFNGRLIEKSGISGQIVGTTLNRYSYPLLRYISGDLSKFSGGHCKCQRNYKRFTEVEGRVQNMVVTKDHRIIPLTALIFGQHLSAFNKIIKLQIFQEIPGKVEVKVIKGSSFTEQDASELIKKLSEATNYSVDFSLTYHAELERTTSGKHQFLIQKLKIDYYNSDQPA